MAWPLSQLWYQTNEFSFLWVEKQQKIDDFRFYVQNPLPKGSIQLPQRGSEGCTQSNHLN
jgi:hypothetical protein